MEKRKLSFWQIWNMSFGFLGIQFGFALQNANTSRIFETLGADTNKLSLYWLAAPLTGFIVQPIVGYFSDRTWTKLGRRKPYFLVGAILSTIALFCMPNSPTLWIGIGTLWIMDSSFNISMEPFRAFVGDSLSEEQRTLGFVMQSFLIGTGAVIGSALPWIFTNIVGLENTAESGIISPSMKWSFYVGATVLFMSVLWTIIKSKEYSPEELESFDKSKNNADDFLTDGCSISKQRNIGLIAIIIGAILTYFVHDINLRNNDANKELYILSVGILITGILFVIASIFRTNNQKNSFTNIVTDLLNMPTTMKQLAWVQFFSWFALFAMWIYTTKAVTSHIYNTTDTTSKIYNDAADWVDIMFTAYNFVAAVVAFLLPMIAKKYGSKITHSLALCMGGIGLISIYFVSSKIQLILTMIGVGVAWSSILSMPYAMLSGVLPANKMGYFMGVFNFFIVIPQIVAGSILGYLLENYFHSQSIYCLIVGGCSMIMAGILTLQVKTEK